jgi:transposase
VDRQPEVDAPAQLPQPAPTLTAGSTDATDPRFPDRNHFASWTGTAPIDASSGEQIRHRLSRAGNRRLSHVLYIAAVCQIRHDTPGRRYYQRKLAEGKTPLEALRCLRRRRRRSVGAPSRPPRPAVDTDGSQSRSLDR